MKRQHEANTHTQQLSLVFRGTTDPTRAPWVLGRLAKGERKGKVGEGGGEGGIIMQMMESEGRKEARKEGRNPKLLPATLTLSNLGCGSNNCT